ncbi:unnamed protein product [Colias eurytheme]|nr:unnamed protein product [Colias eurytheme]
MFWSNDHILEFVELYKNEEIIWDPKHTSHKNRNEVTEAWERIRENMSIECTVVDLKKKKESLMTAFRNHIKRKRKNPDYQTSWFPFSAMESFLGGRYECDSTHQSETEFYDTYNTSQTGDPLQTISNPSTSERLVTVKQPKPPLRKPIVKHQHQINLNVKKAISDSPHEQSYNFDRRELDECDLYCQLLAKKLRRLDEHQRDVVMHEIDNLIFNAKMESSHVNYSDSISPAQPRKIKSPIFIVTPTGNNQFDEENSMYQEQNDT